MEELPKRVIKILKPIVKREEIALAYLFGSYARGRVLFDSDLDLAIYLKDSSLGEKFVENLRDEIIKKTRREWVDILVLNNATYYWRYVGINGVLLYCQDEEFKRSFEVRTRLEYWDWEYYEDYYDKCFLERLKRGGSSYSEKKYYDAFEATKRFLEGA